MSLDLTRGLLTKRYFYRRGHRPQRFNWLVLYKAISDFKLLFRLSFDLRTNRLEPQYVSPAMRWANQMRFFQLYLRFLKRVKWFELPLRRVFFFLGKAKRMCYLGLVNQLGTR